MDLRNYTLVYTCWTLCICCRLACFTIVLLSIRPNLQILICLIDTNNQALKLCFTHPAQVFNMTLPLPNLTDLEMDYAQHHDNLDTIRFP